MNKDLNQILKGLITAGSAHTDIYQTLRRFQKRLMQGLAIILTKTQGVFLSYPIALTSISVRAAMQRS